MVDDEVQHLFEQLQSAASVLKSEALACPDKITKILDGTTPLPAGCPSRASLAKMALRKIEGDVSSTEEAHNEIIIHISHNYRFK